jgi:UDP-glucose 4-epimerase
MAVLITGGCGLVGSNVAKAFAKRSIDCLLFDKRIMLWDFLDPYGKQIKTVTGDVSNYNDLLEITKRYDIEGVVHLAAIKFDKDCKDNPLLAFGVNVSSTQYVLEIARISGMRRVLVASSAAVFGNWKDRNTMIEEDNVVTPGGLYATTKNISELLVRGYKQVYATGCASFRVSRIYGPGVIVAKPESNPISTLAYKCVFEEKVNEPSGLDFHADFSFVEDVAEGIVNLYLAEKLTYDLYHIASGVLYNVGDVVSILRDIFPNISIAVGRGEQPYAGQAPIRGALSIERAKREVGYEVKHTLREGLIEYLDWLSIQKAKQQ